MRTALVAFGVVLCLAAAAVRAVPPSALPEHHPASHIERFVDAHHAETITAVHPSHLESLALLRLHDDDVAGGRYSDLHDLLASFNVLGLKGDARSALRQASARPGAAAPSTMVHHTFQQHHRNVPVFGGTIKTTSHVLANGATSLRSMAGTYMHDIHEASAEPTMRVATAERVALGHVATAHGVPLDTLAAVVEPTLTFINPVLADPTAKLREPVLTWRMHVADTRATVHRNVFVHAAGNLGVVADYTLMAGAMNRTLFVGNLSNPVWFEGDGPIPAGEANNTIEFAEVAYDLYLNTMGVDSWDGQGSPMLTVYDDDGLNCPNAQWNGVTTRYCPGVTGIDTVVHEWSHAYIQEAAGLVYLYQSGALNEAYADIAGATAQLFMYTSDLSPMTARNGSTGCTVYMPGTSSGTYINVHIVNAGGVMDSAGEIAINFNPADAALWVEGTTFGIASASDTPGVSITEGCSPLITPMGGAYGLVLRGSCSFADKFTNILNAGGSGMLVVDYPDNGEPTQPGGLDLFSNPAAMISWEDGAVLSTLNDHEGYFLAGNVTVDPDFALQDTYRWLSGAEDVGFGGPIRDMWVPECRGHPGSVDSASYWCFEQDNGGVHINSGVANRLFALLVDGGESGGQTYTGVGFTKAWHIHVHALYNYHTEISTFAQHGSYLAASCADLTGIDLPSLLDGTPSGEVIGVADCGYLADALTEVAIDGDIPCDFTPVLNEDFVPCATFETLAYSQDFNVSDGGYTTTYASPSPTFTPRTWNYTNEFLDENIEGYAWFGPNDPIGDCVSESEEGIVSLFTTDITVSGLNGRNFFFLLEHSVALEDEYDGGLIFYAINGVWQGLVQEDWYTTNAPNMVLTTTASNNPFAGTYAFSGADEGGLTGSPGVSAFNIPGVVDGDTINLEFALATDCAYGIIGWSVLGLHTFACDNTCGDGYCSDTEDCVSCPDDCTCLCGDNVCQKSATVDDCPLDCASDGECQPGEISVVDCCGPLADCYFTDVTFWVILTGNPVENFFEPADDNLFPSGSGLIFQGGVYGESIQSSILTYFYGEPATEYTLVVTLFAICDGSDLSFSVIIGVDTILTIDDPAGALCHSPAEAIPPFAYDTVSFDVTPSVAPGKGNTLILMGNFETSAVFVDSTLMMTAAIPPTTAAPATAAAQTDCPETGDLDAVCESYCEDEVCGGNGGLIAVMIIAWVLVVVLAVVVIVLVMRGGSGDGKKATNDVDLGDI